jgi:hypothetical protein
MRNGGSTEPPFFIPLRFARNTQNQKNMRPKGAHFL